MNGVLISKKLGMSWECPNREPHRCSLRHCLNKRREYRRKTHELRKEKDNEANRKRYHERYKNDPRWMKKRRESWRQYAKRMGPEWVKERSKKYQKPYSKLSDSARSKIRAAYTKWAKDNWDWRVEYARQYRRKNPVFNFRKKISDARRSGDIGKLAQECLDAIIRAYDEGS